MRFQVSVVVGVLLIVSVMAVLTVSTVLSVARLNARQSADRLFESVSAVARERTVSLLQPAIDLATVVAFMSDVDAEVSDGGIAHPVLSVLTRVLTAQPELYSAYIGYPDGSFIMVINGEQKAREATSGPFTDFDMTPAEQREFEIGSWLHDCGKVTTPEYVVDKATKLETIYNRLHEIRTRFEVLLRDAEIHRLESIIAGVDPGKADLALEETRRQLDDDFSFVAECNVRSDRDSPSGEGSGQDRRRGYLRAFAPPTLFACSGEGDNGGCSAVAG